MESHDYPIAHFERMRALALALKRLPAQILEHHYLYDTFGSWHILVRHKGVVAELAFDGRDSYLGMRRATERKPPYSYSSEQRVGEGLGFGNLDDAAVDAICSAIAS